METCCELHPPRACPPTIEQIKAQVKAGNCYCEVTNPQGACCLGNVAKAVQKAMTLVSRRGGETE